MQENKLDSAHLSNKIFNDNQVGELPLPLHNDLIETIARIYIPLGFQYSQPHAELNNAEYGGYHFSLNDTNIRFRVAKITPTKVGQFVTIWKRNNNGTIQPYDTSEAMDYYVICARKDDYWGQFVFPASVLCKHNILSNQGIGGKRAFRIYPPWDIPISRQAQNTQKWQLPYFLNISQHHQVDVDRVKELYIPTR